MIYKNLEAIKKSSIPFYNLYRKIKIDEYRIFNYNKTSKDLDIYIQGRTKRYISSIAHKTEESKLLVREILKDDADEIIVLGLGSIEFWRLLLNEVDSEVKVHIIEFTEVIDIMMRNGNLKKILFNKMSSLTLIDDKFDTKNILSKVMSKTNTNIKVFVLPQYERIFKKEIEQFYSLLKGIIADKRSTIKTNQGYQKRWIYNSIINFKHVISTPKFLDLEAFDFSNASAIIVGAGPSLSQELDLLKKLSDQGHCYIFALGSAYRALVRNDIRIDALFSYDPSQLNADVLSEYFENNMNIPICFGSSIDFDSIRKVSYDKAFHLVTSQDYFSSYLLEGVQKDIVVDAPSVVVIALQALTRIGFKNIVFVGQNLAYLNERNYAEGIDYKRLSNKSYKSELMIKDVFGNDVSTMKGYKTTLDVMEAFINQHPNIKFTNTTFGGAAISGAPYMPLSGITFNHFDEILNLIEIVPKADYDLIDSKRRFEELLEERKKFIDLLHEGFQLIYEVKEGNDNNTHKDLNLLASLEKVYNMMTENMYFKILISKLDRNYLNIFESNVISINRENDINKKYDLIYNKMGTLFTLFKKDDKDIFKLFNYITSYIVWE